MTTVGIDEAAELLQNLRYLGPCWTGTAFVPCWGETLEVNLDPVEEGRLTPRQLAILRAILRHPRNLRSEFEQRLFEYYQQSVYGCIEFLDDDGKDISEECAPRLQEAGQIWNLIDGPEVYIRWCCRPEYEAAIECELDFTCTWDEEHGLGVRYRDWEIQYIGGWGG